jgi:hypothetical protein
LDTERTLHSTLRPARSRLGLLAAAVGLLAALVLPTTASAARPLTTGFESDIYQSPDANTRNLWFDKTVDSGAGIVRLGVSWMNLAGATRPANPSDPNAYDFSAIDTAVRDAKAHGLQVMLITGGAPPWAEGPGRPASADPGTWRPNPSDFADFTKAIASRYNGNFDPDGAGPQQPLPAAQAIEVWNEPNTSGAIQPQFEGKTDVAAGIYRDLLNAAYDAVKSVNPKMLVVTGGTDPYGDPPGGPYPPGIQRVQPVTFWQDVLCVRPVKTGKTGKTGKKGKKKAAAPKYVRTNGCSGPVKFDALAHHPIDNTGMGPEQQGPLPGDASTPDLGRVTNVLRGAEKAGTTLPGKHQVWVTEFWWDSSPPNPQGAKLPVQARWIEQSLYFFWKGGADTAFAFVVGDMPQRPGVRAGFQSGVYFDDGRPKPSLTAFRFPFVTERLDKRHLQAWGKSPEAGQLAIQRRQRNRWVNMRKLQVSKGGTFATKLTVTGGKQQLRAVVGGSQSLTWKQAAFATKSSGGGLSGWKFVLLLIAGLALLLVVAGLLRRRQVVRRRRISRTGRPRAERLSSSTAG